MRKLVKMVLVCSLAPAFLALPRGEAQTIRDEAEKYGYSQEFLQELPKHSKPLKRVSPQPVQTWTQGPTQTEQVRPDTDLHPRVYQAPEPSSLIPTLIRLHQKDPQSAKITRKLALTCLEANQTQEALHWFSMTWQRDRSDLAALWNLGALTWRQGDRQAARAFLQEYARLDPYSPWGKTARQMIEYEFLTDAGGNFDGNMPRVGISLPGGTASGGSLLVIDGRTTLPDLYAEPNRFPVDNPLKPSRKDASGTADLGKKSLLGKKDSAKEPISAAPDASKSPSAKPSLDKAVIDALPSAPGKTASGAVVPTPPPAPQAPGAAAPPPPPPGK